MSKPIYGSFAQPANASQLGPITRVLPLPCIQSSFACMESRYQASVNVIIMNDGHFFRGGWWVEPILNMFLFRL